MNSIVCIRQSDADAYSAAVDAKIGLPLPALYCPGGRHGNGGTTTHYAAVTKHPTLPQWSYPFDATVSAQSVSIPSGASVAALDVSWVPAAQSIGIENV